MKKIYRKIKKKLLKLLIIIVLGTIQRQESFSKDTSTFPPCNTGNFVSDDVQCHTKDSPPCPTPSIEKNGLCIVKKIDICERENILKNGTCMPNTGDFQIDDPTFTKQHLLTGNPMFDPTPGDFRESDDYVGMLYAYLGLSLVGIIIGFFAIKKWKNRK